MLAFSNDSALALDLGEFNPKANTTTHGQKSALRYLHGSKDTPLRIGVWECTPGKFSATHNYDEVVHVLKGAISLKFGSESEKRVRAGDNFILLAGAQGEWTIHETARIIFVIHN